VRNVSYNKLWRKSKFTFYVEKYSFFPENHAVYEIKLKNILETNRPQMTMQ
jgi:hypothetical protein